MTDPTGPSPVVNEWIDADDLESKAKRRRRESAKIAAVYNAGATWFEEFEKANHFRQQWLKVTGGT